MARPVKEEDTRRISQIIEIQDWLMANPDAPKHLQVKIFCSIFQKSTRTIWSYFKVAEKQILETIQKAEAAKQDVYIEKAKEIANKNIMSRTECLEMLTKTARMRAIRIEGLDDVMMPSFSESTRAIMALADLLNWRVKPESVENKEMRPLQINVLSEEALKAMKKIKADNALH